MGIVLLTACENLDLSKVSPEDAAKIANAAIVCPDNYLRFGVDCCLDKNNNSLCDKDEGQEQSNTISENEECKSDSDCKQGDFCYYSALNNFHKCVSKEDHGSKAWVSNVSIVPEEETNMCVNECNTHKCEGVNYFACTEGDDGCYHLAKEGVVTMGRCDVNCLTDSDCGTGKECHYSALNQFYACGYKQTTVTVTPVVEKTYEEYTLEKTSSDEASFNFVNVDGKKIEIPIYLNTFSSPSSTWKSVSYSNGKTDNENILAPSSGFYVTCGSYSDPLKDCEGVRILASDFGGVAHIFEVSNIDPIQNKIDLYDQTYGRTYADLTYTPGTSSALDLGSFGQITVYIVNGDANKPSEFTIKDSLHSEIKTKAGTKLEFSYSGQINSIKIKETYTIKGSNGKSLNDMILYAENYDGNLKLSAKVDNSQIQLSSLGSGSDFSVATTPVGTKVTVDTTNFDSVHVEVPN